MTYLGEIAVERASFVTDVYTSFVRWLAERREKSAKVLTVAERRQKMTKAVMASQRCRCDHVCGRCQLLVADVVADL